MCVTTKSVGVCLLCLVLVGSLTGCETMGPKTAIGGLGGATAGGLFAAVAGGDAAGIAAGTIIGGLIGSAIGSGLDAQDRQYAQQAAQHAFERVPSGTSVPWQNPDSGNSGSFRPTQTYQTSQGVYCREYQQTVIIGGQEQSSYGTACRQPDGSWKIVN